MTQVALYRVPKRNTELPATYFSATRPRTLQARRNCSSTKVLISVRLRSAANRIRLASATEQRTNMDALGPIRRDLGRARIGNRSKPVSNCTARNTMPST